MIPVEHPFLFSSLGSKRPLTIRKFHIRRLYDILQLCIQRHDLERAKRAWATLARCKELDWKSLWTTGLYILGVTGYAGQDIEYLRTMMLQHPDDRQCILKELIFRLLLSGKYRGALDELELYLPSFPYQENPVLHIYAGLCSLHLACGPSAAAKSHFNSYGLIREAEVHLERAKILDPDNLVVQAFLDKIKDLQSGQKVTQNDSDEEFMAVEPNRKRSRI